MQSIIVKNTISLLISKLVPSILLTLINIIYSRYLSQNDYGVYQTLWSYINIFIIISTFGLPRYILTFGSLYKYTRIAAFKIVAIVFLFTLIPIISYLLFFENIFSTQSVLLFIVLLISQSFYLIQEANVLSQSSNKILIYSNVSYALLLFASHILVLYLGYTIDLCLMFIIGVSIIRNIIILYSLNKISHTVIHAIETLKEKAQLIWFGVNDTLQILTKWMDKLLLIVILTSSDYAVYFNGTYEIPLIGMGLSAFQTIIITQSAKPESTDESNIQLFKSSSLFMSAILFPLFSLCFLFSNEIITLLFSSRYTESAGLFAISALLIPMRICNYTVLLQLKSKGKTILMGSIIDGAAAVVLMIILYPYFGLKGLALAVVLATYIQAAFYLVEIKKIYSTSFDKLIDFKKLFLRFAISISVLFSVKLVTQHLSGTISLFIATAVFLILMICFADKIFKFKAENN
jgi:O-antigen/teichoic acid export membrane protein